MINFIPKTENKTVKGGCQCNPCTCKPCNCRG